MKINKKTTMILIMTLLVLITSCAQNGKSATTGFPILDFNAPDSGNAIQTDNFVLTKSGNVGIGVGTDSPRAKLDVRGTVRLESLSGVPGGKFLCIDAYNVVYRSESLCNYGIFLKSPGTQIVDGIKLTLEWTYAGLTSTDKVSIAYFDVTGTEKSIATNVLNTGSYVWTPNLQVTADYPIRISVSSGALKGTSNYITVTPKNSPVPTPEPTPEPESTPCSTDPELIERSICW